MLFGICNYREIEQEKLFNSNGEQLIIYHIHKTAREDKEANKTLSRVKNATNFSYS
tara:strand:- start:58072 stop:58239 length:168 start_codon:yes stop_codon:yes gene_type:complete